jgi:hypothetical protein
MKSPFPGMDPFMERHWLDVHAKLVAYAADQLNTRLPEDLVASTEERVAVEDEEYRPQAYSPDIHVRSHRVEISAEQAAPVASIAAPLRLVARIEPATEGFVHILEVDTGLLVTVIEFVSPTNKLGRGLAAFRTKREELLASNVNFVEIDLVRGGNWQALLRPHVCPPDQATPYRATVRETADPPAVYVYPIRLQDRLPSIRIPLRDGDPPIELELQPLIENAYANGRYDRRLDYAIPLEPLIGKDDAIRVQQICREQNKK